MYAYYYKVLRTCAFIHQDFHFSQSLLLLSHPDEKVITGSELYGVCALAFLISSLSSIIYLGLFYMLSFSSCLLSSSTHPTLFL